ncbi:MAG: hypothetical protein ACRD1Z_22375, partial [Vicinamibacteria bacterium]
MATGGTEARRESVEAALGRLLESRAFSRASHLRRFLDFTVRKTLDGREDEVKEYTIAVEAYGRRKSHDSRLDPIVRTDAQRLRKKLAAYYEGEGSGENVRIVYPKGSYVPVFVSNGGAGAAEAPQREGEKASFPWLPVAAFAAIASIAALAF